MEYVIRHTKSRVWLLEYGSDHNLAKLKWAWTLEWNRATRYPTEEAAMAQATAFDLKDFTVESAQLKTKRL